MMMLRLDFKICVRQSSVLEKRNTQRCKPRNDHEMNVKHCRCLPKETSPDYARSDNKICD